MYATEVRTEYRRCIGNMIVKSEIYKIMYVLLNTTFDVIC